MPVLHSCGPAPTPHDAPAIARLEDESQLVVRAALQLLRLMVAKGIFQPPLKAQVCAEVDGAAASCQL
jgi:hypothetical protein